MHDIWANVTLKFFINSYIPSGALMFFRIKRGNEGLLAEKEMCSGSPPSLVWRTRNSVSHFPCKFFL